MLPAFVDSCINSELVARALSEAPPLAGLRGLRRPCATAPRAAPCNPRGPAQAGADRSCGDSDAGDRHAERLLRPARLARRHRRRYRTRPGCDRTAFPAAAGTPRRRRADPVGELGQPSGPAQSQPALLHVYDPTGAGTGLGAPRGHADSRVLEAGSWSAAIVGGLLPEPADVRYNVRQCYGFTINSAALIGS